MSLSQIHIQGIIYGLIAVFFWGSLMLLIAFITWDTMYLTGGIIVRFLMTIFGMFYGIGVWM